MVQYLCFSENFFLPHFTVLPLLYFWKRLDPHQRDNPHSLRNTVPMTTHAKEVFDFGLTL